MSTEPTTEALEAAQADAEHRLELADLDVAAPATAGEDRYTAEELARLDNLLEVNGFNAVRAEVVNAVSVLERIPPEAYEAGKTYAERAAARMRLDTTIPAEHRAQAIRQAERDVAVFEAARRFRRELERVAERIATRERITSA